MTGIFLEINENGELVARTSGKLYSHSKGIPVFVTIKGQAWKDLNAVLICTCNNVNKKSMILNGTGTIPAECLIANQHLYLAVDATQGNELRIPTNLADCGLVYPSAADIKCQDECEVTPNLLNQLLAQINSWSKEINLFQKEIKEGKYNGKSYILTSKDRADIAQTIIKDNDETLKQYKNSFTKDFKTLQIQLQNFYQSVNQEMNTKIQKFNQSLISEFEKFNQSLTAKLEELQKSIAQKYTKPIGGIPEEDLDAALAAKINTTVYDMQQLAKIKNSQVENYIFDTESDMIIWLNNKDNAAKLQIGDNLFIRDVDSPDYWWDGTSAQFLETPKIILDQYEQKIIPISKDAYKALEDKRGLHFVYDDEEDLCGSHEVKIYYKI